MAQRIVKFRACDGKVFDSLEEANEHEETLPGAGIRGSIVNRLKANWNDGLQEFDLDTFVDQLLRDYNITVKPVPFTGELRWR